jgi:hypothetical protein
MNLHPGDVVPIRVPFHQSSGSKVRPVLVVLDSGDGDFAGVPITSRIRDSEFDLEISDLQSAGLNVSSVGRVHKPGVLSKAAILRHLSGGCRKRIWSGFLSSYAAPTALGNRPETCRSLITLPPRPPPESRILEVVPHRSAMDAHPKRHRASGSSLTPAKPLSNRRRPSNTQFW